MPPTYRLAHNLRPDTSTPSYRSQLRPWGYLLAPSNATPAIRARALELRVDKYGIVADNGNFVEIGRVASTFRTRAQVLFDEINVIELRLKRCVRPNDVPTSLRTRFRGLARDVQREVGRVIHARGNPLPRQLEVRPTHVIGAEDITIAVWLALNFEQAYAGIPRGTFRALNDAVATRAATERAAVEVSKARYLPVVSALSYNTALDAGRSFARAGHMSAAMGFGAYMADDHYSDYLDIGARRIVLPVAMPNRYIRTIAVARGFWTGYSGEAGRSPEAFHFLGLGAPIMVALAALCAWGTNALTFDAMSPIMDAVEGTLYTSKPAYLKLRTRSIAFRFATTPGAVWDCPCRTCAQFQQEFPFDYGEGRAWHNRTKAKEVAATDLRPGGTLFQAYPLLSEPTAGPLRRRVSEVRMGHNHWVLNSIMAALGRHSRTKQDLSTFVRGVTGAYGRATSSPRFRDAIDFAYRLATDQV